MSIWAENHGMTSPEWSHVRLIVSFAGSSSHFRSDFGCWNFLYLKSALNLIATPPMQACCNQECRA